MQGESLCQWLREKHHHHKLLPVTTTASTRCKGQGARCKDQDQHQHKSERDATTTCNSNHRHHRPAQDLALCTLTCAPCACGGCHRQQLMVLVFLLRPLAQRLHLHKYWFHPLQLAPVVFLFLPTGADSELMLGNLHCVVVVFWWWWWWVNVFLLVKGNNT